MSEQSSRIESLDVLRGATIAAMILVNNPGSWNTIYPPLEHAPWHGCTPTDLIFPFFLFIVGVTTTISLGKLKESSAPRGKLYGKIAYRAAMLFALGILMSTFPFFSLTKFVLQFPTIEWIDWSHVRIPGVLQRIGVVYFFASIVFLEFDIKKQAIIGASLLIIYWILMCFVPVPGIGPANLEKTTNLAALIDRTVLGSHLWVSSKVWDPEGILSTLPAVATTICGIMLGHWMRTKNDPLTKTVWIFIAGTIAMGLGYIWSLHFPLNKNIWTSSYVLYTAGLALLCFGLCYWFVDILGYKKWTKPFIIYGMNAITVFVLSGYVARLLGNLKLRVGMNHSAVSLKAVIYDNIYLPLFSPINASLAFALSYVLFWLFIMWIFYRKGVFLKI